MNFGFLLLVKNENIYGEENANNAHFEVGSIVRKAIIKAGGTVPEKLPTPEKSLKELKKENLKKIEGGCSFSFRLKLFVFGSKNA